MMFTHSARCSEWCFQIWSDVCGFGVMFSNWKWCFRIRSDVFEFRVIRFRIQSDKFSNSEWCFWIRVEFSNSEWWLGNWSIVLDFGVSYQNSEWVFRIRSVFKDKECNFDFGVHLWATAHNPLSYPKWSPLCVRVIVWIFIVACQTMNYALLKVLECGKCSSFTCFCFS